MPSRQKLSQKDTEDTKKVESVLNQTRCNKGITSSPSFAQGLQAVQVTIYSLCVCTPASHGHGEALHFCVKHEKLNKTKDQSRPTYRCLWHTPACHILLQIWLSIYLSIYRGCKNYAWSTSAFLVREVFYDGCVEERCHFGVLSILLSCTYFSEGLHLKRVFATGLTIICCCYD